MVFIINPALEGLKDNKNEQSIQIAETIIIKKYENEILTKNVSTLTKDIMYTWDIEEDIEIEKEALKEI